jgi:hypothetical protein
MSAITPPGQEGWLCHKENIAKQPLSAQTGWLFKIEQNNWTTTPALRATPPVQEGQCPVPHFIHTLIDPNCPRHRAKRDLTEPQSGGSFDLSRLFSTG